MARGANAIAQLTRPPGRGSTMAQAICLMLIVGCGSGGVRTGGHPDGAAASDGAAGGAGPGDGTGGAPSAGAGGGSQLPPLPAGLTVLAGLPGGVGQRDDLGRAARFAVPFGLADDGHGHLYIADSGAGTIRKLDLASGALTTVAGSPSYSSRPSSADGVGAAARFLNPTDVAVTGDSVYVADYDRLRRIDTTSGAVTTIAGGDGASPPVFDLLVTIATDGQGNVYAGTRHTIAKIEVATGRVTTLVGQPDSSDVVDGVGPAGHLGEPRALALDGGGALYVLDGGAVRRVELATNALTTLPVTLPGGIFNHHLAGMTSDRAGHLYLSDLYFDVVYRLTLASGEVAAVSGADNVAGSEDGPPPQGHLNFPTAVTMGSDGALYLSDRDNATIRRIDPSTGTISTLAGEPPHAGSSDGERGLGRFKLPLGLSTDASGNVYVADFGNRAIRRLVVATGAVGTVAGDPLQSSGSADGIGPAARFIEPVGVAVGPPGVLFVVDDLAFNVRRIDLMTRSVTTIAGKAGEIGGGDGPGSVARFWTPVGIAFDRAGTGAVLVTDANAAVRRIDTLSGDVTTAVRLPTLPGGGYALGNPIGVASDGNGNAYVADADQHTISKVELATGAVTLIAGSRNQPGATDGAGSAARFNVPTGVAYDGGGHLFVTEPENHVVRRVTIATGEVTTVVGVAAERGVKTGPLPGRLNSPLGIAVLPSGDLVISDRAENVILLAR